MNENPLVSAVIVTYNSSSTIIETLESIKAQTYQNLELIVSDDCSSDNTIEVVNAWLKDNTLRFRKSDLLTVSKNTGVSGNINRGVFSSHGKWVKTLAGDDLLMPSAIDEYMRFVSSHPDSVKMCVSDVVLFSEDEQISPKLIEVYDDFFKKEQEPYEQQYRRVCKELVFVGPGYFYSRELFDEIGGCSEKYEMLDEWPLVYKVLKKGYQIYPINKKLVKYRISNSSLCRVQDEKGLGNKRLFLSIYQFFFGELLGDLIKSKRYLLAWDLSLYYKTQYIRYNIKNVLIADSLYKLGRLASPLWWIRKVKHEEDN